MKKQLAVYIVAALAGIARVAAAADPPRASAIVVLPAEPVADGIVVTIDGTPLDVLGAPRTVDPGKHHIAVTAPAKEPWETTIETGSGGAAALVRAPLLREAPASPAAGAEERVVERPHRGGTALIALGFSVGGAGLLTGVVTGAAAFAVMSDVKDQCPNKVCPPGNQAYSLAKTFATIADVAFPVAAVGFTVGIIGLVQRGSSDAPTSERPGASLRIGPGSVDAKWTF